MPFCNHCGTEVPENANFCHVCGKPISVTDTEQSQRKQVFEGNIHKCPNCGETLPSFQRNCPCCGFEFRDVKSSSAIREFTDKLSEIEASRSKGKLFGLIGKSNTDIIKEKIALIENYPVPNSKEDMLEFMVLATSNINASVFGMDRKTNEKKLASAWLSKAKQVYEKANSSCGYDSDTNRINELYNNCNKEVQRIVKKKKRNEFLGNAAVIGVAISPIIICVIIGIHEHSASKRNNMVEEDRLNETISVVERAEEKNDYKYALRIAESIEYNGSDQEREKWWNIQRETMVDRIILEAEQEGTHLEPSPIPTIEPEEDRLNKLISKIEEAEEKKDYKKALRLAESIEYHGSDYKREKWWNTQRESMVDQIILEAELEGIQLEPSPNATRTPRPTRTSKTR